MSRVTTPWIGRRALIAGAAATTTSLLLPPRIALAMPELTPTPAQTEGPFYPTDWTGDIDNDLVQVTGEAARSLGQVVHVRGRVLGSDGTPIAGARVEIWQCDANGVYRHPRDMSPTRRRDDGFQGRGRVVADAAGHYSFRTIRPVAYPGRTPHIHYSIELPDRRRLVTQMYVAGEPLNARDGILNAIANQRQRDSVIVRLEAADGIENGALAGTFDIVMA